MQIQSILNRKIKVALVGCGRISNNHFNAINHHQTDLELIAVCDPNSDRLAQAITQQSVKGYATLEQLLVEEPTVDVVILCTPSGIHAEQTCITAEAGKHVITEKPMATRWQDGLRMVKACDKANVYLFVVKQNRHNSTICALKKAIESDRFGRIYLVNSNVFWTRPQAYYDQDAWRGTWEFDGGAFMNQASHYIDLLDWLIGPVESVQAMMGTLARNIEVEDTGVLNIKWRSGALGSMSVTMLAFQKNLEGSITILGEKGIVKLGGPALNQIEHWEFADANDSQDEMAQLNYEISSVYGTGHLRYYENVIKVFRGEAKPQTDGREGLKSLELLVSAYLAKKESKTIHLPLEL
ncbi:MAG: Gfo/Idh/MocA family oxidoreductase [Gammaproteobacteria bacterium]|nr:Gfo/Idh/MocA family oxidoreductase [Gammaproteobacteria bacterium]